MAEGLVELGLSGSIAKEPRPQEQAMILICTAKAKYLQLKVNVDNGKEFNTLPYIEQKTLQP